LTTCPALEGWSVTPPLLSAFVAWPTFTFVHWKFSSENSTLCPTSILQNRFSFPPLPLLSLSDYSLLFMFFNFAGGGGGVVQSAQGLHQSIFSGVCRGVLDGVWFSPVLQFHSSSFGAGWWGEIEQLFSVQHSVGRFSMG
jgi:hypothetical protein